MKKILLVLVSVLIVGGASWTGYQEGLLKGETKGYHAGYQEVIDSYPRLEFKDMTVTKDGMTITLRDSVFVGEESVVNMVKKLPNLQDIIIFEDGNFCITK